MCNLAVEDSNRLCLLSDASCVAMECAIDRYDRIAFVIMRIQFACACFMFCGMGCATDRAMAHAMDCYNTVAMFLFETIWVCPLHVLWHKPCHGCAMDRAINRSSYSEFKLRKQFVYVCFMCCGMECATGAPRTVPRIVVTLLQRSYRG